MRSNCFKSENSGFGATVICILLLMTAFVLCACDRTVSPEVTESPTPVTDAGVTVTDNPVSGGDITESAVTDTDVTERELLGEGMLKAVYFDAGHADSFLLYTDSATILIDSGEKGFGKDVVKYLDSHGIDSIDYMFITHFDKDHVGGAAKIIREKDVFTVYTCDYVKSSDELQAFSDAAAEKNVTVNMLLEGQSLEIGGMKIDINTPERMMYESDPSNNSSLIIRVTHGEKSFLFMGDAQTPRLLEYITGKPEHCDVLKVPYHGIYQPSLKELCDAVSADYAVITSSKKEKEDTETNKILKDCGTEIYKTRKGTIEFLSDGHNLSVKQIG